MDYHRYWGKSDKAGGYHLLVYTRSKIQSPHRGLYFGMGINHFISLWVVLLVAASVLEMKKTGDLYLVTHKNRFLDTCLKIFFYAIALAFTFLWTLFLWGIFYSEGNLTWEIRLACFLIGLILHIPFVLLTFRIQKRWIRIALAIVLIPVLLVHFGFFVMLWDSWLWGGGWALCVVGIAYYQLFKGVIHDQKSN